jgi:hypothetical protein
MLLKATAGRRGAGRSRLQRSRSARHGSRARLWDGFRYHQEWRRGYQVRYALLEACDYDKRHAVEQQWIRRFPRDDLLNRRKKYSSYVTIGSSTVWLDYRPPKPPRISEIENYRRRYIFNVDGFRGVHYERDSGYYRVLVYNGRWAPNWLQDELADGGHWFSDLARALSALHNEQDAYRALMKERREADILAARSRERDRIARGDEEDWTEGVPTPLAEGTLQAIGGKLYYPAPDTDPLRMAG